MPDVRALGGKPWGTAIHATAVAIAGRGLLILGPSRSGKSRLAFALMCASTRRRPVVLIGDDRVLVSPAIGGLVVRPHPRLAGFIERRGLGIVAAPFIEAAPVAAIMAIGSTTLPAVLSQNLEALADVYINDGQAPPTSEAVLAWWRGACTTPLAKAARRH